MSMTANQPQTADDGGMVRVSEWADIADSDVTDKEAVRVAGLLNDGAQAVVVAADWLADDPDKDLDWVPGSSRICIGAVADYSADAWKLLQPASGETFLPKSQVSVFALAGGVGSIEPPQASLGSFGGGER